jgi:glycosyltransferase involved in cell wall biosynthesis
MQSSAPSTIAPPWRISLLIVNSTLHIGGAEQVAAWLASHVNPDSFDLHACYLKEPGHIAEQMLREGVKLRPIPGLRAGRRDYLTFIKLRRLVRQLGVRIIHTHDLHGMIDGAACRLTTPGLRFVHTFHFGNYPHRSWRHKLMEKALWRIADALVAVGHIQMDAIRKLYGISAERIRVIWNGVRDAAPATGITHDYYGRIPAGVPVIASISTLIPQKGLEHLLDAAALLRRDGIQFVLLIAGDGFLREDLFSRAKLLGLSDSVRFLGWVPQASTRLLPRCDIFVQSSLWEATSVVVLEAMAATKPMVVTSVGDNCRIIIDGQTGLIVPPANPHALANKLQLLIQDAGLRQRLAQGARERYECSFTLQHMTSAYERLYQEILGDQA